MDRILVTIEEKIVFGFKMEFLLGMNMSLLTKSQNFMFIDALFLLVFFQSLSFDARASISTIDSLQNLSILKSI